MSASQPPLRLTQRGRIVLAGLVLVFLWAVGTRLLGGGSDDPGLGAVIGSTESDAPQTLRVAATWAVPEDGFLLDDDGPAALDLVEAAPVVVVADRVSRPEAVWVASQLSAPLVEAPVAGGTVTLDLPDGWGTRVVIDVGDREPVLAAELRRIALPLPEVEVGADDTEPVSDLASLREAVELVPVLDRGPIEELLDAAPEPRSDRPFTALVRPEASVATLVSLVLAGAAIEQTQATDLFAADTALLDGLTGPVVQAGSPEDWDDVDKDTWTWQRATIANGVELPGGGYRVFPGDRRYVALYGSPETTALGVLGEQGVDASVERARELAASYDGLDSLESIPTWDFIATVASGSPEPTDDFSRRVPQEIIREWVAAAREAGVYVFLDLQSGRTDFLTQAMELEEFLKEPHVGLALDPEWRLEPDEVHLVQIGSVDVAEVNETGQWLADLTRENGLPQKLFLVHQFTTSMFTGKADFADFPELAESVQMDGQGTQPGKLSTWESITKVDAAPHVTLSWKNFYDEDPETRSPAETVALDPSPQLVTYQ